MPFTSSNIRDSNVSCNVSNPYSYVVRTDIRCSNFRFWWRYCAKCLTCTLCRQMAHMHTVPYASHAYCQVSHMYIVPIVPMRIVPSVPYSYCAKYP